MNASHISFLLSLLLFAVSTNVCAGNLSLIEKRLIELDKLNKQAVEQVGIIPKNGSVEIMANVTPGNKPLSKNLPGVQERSFQFGKKKIHAMDNPRPFTVQISSSSSQQQCYRVATMLSRAGYPAFTSSLTMDDLKVWHRIFVGSFATREEAEKTKELLTKEEISDGFIIHMPYAIQVGPTGNLASLKALRDKLFSLEYLPYTSHVLNTTTNTTEARLLVGAFKSRGASTELVSFFRHNGLQVRVVPR